MGYEYKLQIDALNAKLAEGVIRSAPYFADHDSTNGLFNFREQEVKSRTDWPSLAAKIDPDGIYLCHYGNKKLFELVVAYLCDKLTDNDKNFELEEL